MTRNDFPCLSVCSNRDQEMVRTLKTLKRVHAMHKRCHAVKGPLCRNSAKDRRGKGASTCTRDLSRNKKAAIFLHRRIEHADREELGRRKKNRRMSWENVWFSQRL